MTATAARPRVPRRAAVLVAGIVATTLVVLGVSTPAFAAGSGTIASMVNSDRAAHGLRPLVRSGALDAVAARWAQHMVDAGTISHNPNLAAQAPGGWLRLGENVAMGYGPEAMERAWMASPDHRANILGDYTAFGVAYLIVGSSTWGVQVFAKYATTTKSQPAPAPVKAAPAPAKPAPAKPAPAKPAPAPAKPAPQPAPAEQRPVKAAPAKTAAPKPTATRPASATPLPATATPTPTTAGVSPTATPRATASPTAAAAAEPASASVALPLGLAVGILALAATAFAVIRRRRI
nr:CAP domain-containing protein [Microbacterium bovistercoris]